MKKNVFWTKKKRAFINKKIEEYKKIYNLDGWRIDVVFSEERKINGTDCYTADSVVIFEYEKVQLTFYNREKRLDNEGEFENDVSHELAHCLTQELYDLACNRYITPKQALDALERLTSRIEIIIRCSKN